VGRDPGRSVGDVQCRIVGPEELTTADLAAWSDCAAASLEPNPFLEPAWLLPAIEHLDESPTARLAIVEHDGAIHALAPVEQIAAGHDATGAPRGHSALVTRVTPTAVALGTPLVTHQGGADAARSLLAGLRREAARVGASHVILEWIGADGPIAPLLQGVLAHADHPLFQFDSWERAMLRRRPGDDAGYSLRNVGKNRLRTIRQHRRHLDGPGPTLGRSTHSCASRRPDGRATRPTGSHCVNATGRRRSSRRRAANSLSRDVCGSTRSSATGSPSP
jgi:hypothetical protein